MVVASHTHQIDTNAPANQQDSPTSSACENSELRMRMAATKTRSKKRSSHACSDSGDPGTGPGAEAGTRLVGILFCTTFKRADRG